MRRMNYVSFIVGFVVVGFLGGAALGLESRFDGLFASMYGIVLMALLLWAILSSRPDTESATPVSDSLAEAPEPDTNTSAEVATVVESPAACNESGDSPTIGGSRHVPMPE
ncbi:MAG: hypothetical protein JWM80_1264 [Cyanobacteria bacterium RYN_339]|nr:hypothetical protein [Cyanobacteria bacterium RYN_339]